MRKVESRIEASKASQGVGGMILSMGNAALSAIRGEKDGGSYAAETGALAVLSQSTGTDGDGTQSPAGGTPPGRE